MAGGAQINFKYFLLFIFTEPELKIKLMRLCSFNIAANPKRRYSFIHAPGFYVFNQLSANSFFFYIDHPRRVLLSRRMILIPLV